MDMRTTLDIDDDVLSAAKEIAVQRNQTAGKAISDLLRLAMNPTRTTSIRNGIRLIDRPAGAPLTTMAEVNRLRDEA